MSWQRQQISVVGEKGYSIDSAATFCNKDLFLHNHHHRHYLYFMIQAVMPFPASKVSPSF
jgi:hypothetical protein